MLRRMTRLLETTNKSVQASLTLDDEKSPLSRLRRELIDVLEEQKKRTPVSRRKFARTGIHASPPG